MRTLHLALVGLLTLGSVACGDEEGGGSPTSPTSGGGTCTRPVAPANFAANVVFNRVSFTWSAVGGVIDYTVLVGSNPGTSNFLSQNTTQTTYEWNGVQRGTYHARVEARNSCGSGNPSTPVTFTIN